MKHWAAATAVFVVSLLGTAAVAGFLAVLLVGPHSDILPSALRVPFGLLLWLGVLGVPAWLAWATFKKFRHRGKKA